MRLSKNRPKFSPIFFLPKLMLNLNCGKERARKVGYFRNFQKTLLKANNHTMGVNTPNKVTLQGGIIWSLSN
jgi:hypothetical protein